VSSREILRQRASQISAVMNHPGWEEHVAEAKRKIEKLERRAARLALSDNGADQRQLDYIRGWIAALRWTYRMPEAAGQRLEQWLEEEAEDEHVR